MIEFDVNKPGRIYFLNFSRRPEGRGSSGGNIHVSYEIVEQEYGSERRVVLPVPLTGLQVKTLHPDTFKVISKEPKTHQFVGILPATEQALTPNHYMGFISSIKEYSNKEGFDRAFYFHPLRNSSRNTLDNKLEDNSPIDCIVNNIINKNYAKLVALSKFDLEIDA